jgi:hypothetical protein
VADLKEDYSDDLTEATKKAPGTNGTKVKSVRDSSYLFQPTRSGAILTRSAANYVFLPDFEEGELQGDYSCRFVTKPKNIGHQ